jgi:hypothetical protein
MEGVMTREEHELMIAMLAKQRRFTQLLLNILKERKIITPENLPAFEFSIQNNPTLSGELYQETKSSYLQTASALGVKVDLTPKG